MSVDFRAITISFDALYVVAVSVQVILCTFLLIRSSQSLPSHAAIIVLLGGTILMLAADATSLAEDVRKTTNDIPWARILNEQSVIFQIVESLFGAFGYLAVQVSALIMLYRSTKETKTQARVGKAVAVGGFSLLVRLGLDIGSAAYVYQTNVSFIQYRGTFMEYTDQFWKDFYVLRGLSITYIALSGAMIIVLAVGCSQNQVHRVRNAFVFGLIPTLMVKLALTSISDGLYYTGQRSDILMDPTYVYPNTILSTVFSIAVPACILYAGWGWTVADPSYAAQSSVDGGSLEEGKL